MKLSVNILTWNCLETLQESFDFIMDEIKFCAAECIIVDNGSDDGTKEFLEGKTLIYDNLIYHYNETNQGISKGKNKAIDSSSGEYVMMLDADVIPVKNSIRMLVEYLENNSDCHALGFRPDEWSNQKNNKFGQCFHETDLNTLHNVTPINRCCIYYGIYRASLFDKGLRLNEEGEFGKPGYGWEDHDFYERMKSMGVTQYVADVNKPNGKYYHAINSSIRVMGRGVYMQTSRARGADFKNIWEPAKC